MKNKEAQPCCEKFKTMIGGQALIEGIMMRGPEKDAIVTLGHFKELENACTDVRCDLHPRWNRSGTAITFDSVHEGFRGVYEIQLPDEVKNNLFD